MFRLDFSALLVVATVFSLCSSQEYDFAAEITRQCLVPDPVGLLDCVEDKVTLPYMTSWVDCTNSLGQNVKTSADIINYRCKSVWEGKGVIPEVFYIKDCVIEKTGLPPKNVSAEVLGAYKECESGSPGPQQQRVKTAPLQQQQLQVSSVEYNSPQTQVKTVAANQPQQMQAPRVQLQIPATPPAQVPVMVQGPVQQVFQYPAFQVPMPQPPQIVGQQFTPVPQYLVQGRPMQTSQQKVPEGVNQQYQPKFQIKSTPQHDPRFSGPQFQWPVQAPVGGNHNQQHQQQAQRPQYQPQIQQRLIQQDPRPQYQPQIQQRPVQQDFRPQYQPQIQQRPVQQDFRPQYQPQIQQRAVQEDLRPQYQPQIQVGSTQQLVGKQNLSPAQVLGAAGRIRASSFPPYSRQQFAIYPQAPMDAAGSNTYPVGPFMYDFQVIHPQRSML